MTTDDKTTKPDHRWYLNQAGVPGYCLDCGLRYEFAPREGCSGPANTPEFHPLEAKLDRIIELLESVIDGGVVDVATGVERHE